MEVLAQVLGFLKLYMLWPKRSSCETCSLYSLRSEDESGAAILSTFCHYVLRALFVLLDLDSAGYPYYVRVCLELSFSDNDSCYRPELLAYSYESSPCTPRGGGDLLIEFSSEYILCGYDLDGSLSHPRSQHCSLRSHLHL
jgi:hypothetical protein